MKCKICGIDSIKKQDNDYIIKNNRYIHISCYTEKEIKKGRDLESIEKEIEENLLLLKDSKEKDLNKKMFFSEIFNNYEVSVLPKYFFVKVSQIVDGSFVGMRRGISYFELTEMFKMMRKYLDKNNANMQSRGKGFKTELDRLNYDLAIVINSYDKYLKHKTETKNIKQAIVEVENNTKKDIEMKINTKKKSSGNNNSIANIVDEFF